MIGEKTSDSSIGRVGTVHTHEHFEFELYGCTSNSAPKSEILSYTPYTTNTILVLTTRIGPGYAHSRKPPTIYFVIKFSKVRLY